MNDKTLCYCKKLHKSYKNFQVLKDCSLHIRNGELVGLIGENGSGKTTLVQCLLGFTKPTQGFIKLNSSVGYCPQENQLHRMYTVIEHFNLMKAIYKKYSPIDKIYIQELIQKFNLQKYFNTLIGNLSSGTYQKIKLLTALYHKPQLLLLDEPYDGFDWQMYLSFWEIISELKSMGTGTLLISHLVYDYDKFNRIYELKEGKVEQIRST